MIFLKHKCVHLLLALLLCLKPLKSASHCLKIKSKLLSFAYMTHRIAQSFCLFSWYSPLTLLNFQYLKTHLTLFLQVVVYTVSCARILSIFLFTWLISALFLSFSEVFPPPASTGIVAHLLCFCNSYQIIILKMFKCLFGSLLHWTLSFVRAASVPCLLLCFP